MLFLLHIIHYYNVLSTEQFFILHKKLFYSLNSIITTFVYCLSMTSSNEKLFREIVCNIYIYTKCKKVVQILVSTCTQIVIYHLRSHVQSI